MTRDYQEPTERPANYKTGGKEDTVYEHPAYAMIGASRVSGLTTLFGSDFEHHNFLTITISRAELHRGLSTDWYHPRDEIIEIELSEAQWATFVSSPNQGSGVPCTIRHVAGKLAPLIPLRRVEDVTKKEVDAQFKEMSERVRRAIDDISGEIGKSVSGVKREAILNHLQQLDSDIRSSLPFMEKQFGEHMENTVEQAKIEVNAYVQNAINRAGVAAIAGHAPLQLKAGKEKE